MSRGALMTIEDVLEPRPSPVKTTTTVPLPPPPPPTGGIPQSPRPRFQRSDLWGERKKLFVSPRCTMNDEDLFPATTTTTPDGDVVAVLQSQEDRWQYLSQQAGPHQQDATILDLTNRIMSSPEVLRWGVPPQTAARIQTLHLSLKETEDLLPEWLDVLSSMFFQLEHLYILETTTQQQQHQQQSQQQEKQNGCYSNRQIPSTPTATMPTTPKYPHIYTDTSSTLAPTELLECSPRSLEILRMRRLYILYRLPGLQSIDGKPVTELERALARPDTPNGQRVKRNEWLPQESLMDNLDEDDEEDDDDDGDVYDSAYENNHPDYDVISSRRNNNRIKHHRHHLKVSENGDLVEVSLLRGNSTLQRDVVPLDAPLTHRKDSSNSSGGGLDNNTSASKELKPQRRHRRRTEIAEANHQSHQRQDLKSRRQQEQRRVAACGTSDQHQQQLDSKSRRSKQSQRRRHSSSKRHMVAPRVHDEDEEERQQFLLEMESVVSPQHQWSAACGGLTFTYFGTDSNYKSGSGLCGRPRIRLQFGRNNNNNSTTTTNEKKEVGDDDDDDEGNSASSPDMTTPNDDNHKHCKEQDSKNR